MRSATPSEPIHGFILDGSELKQRFPYPCGNRSPSRAVLVGAYHRAVNQMHRPIYASVTVCELLQRSQDTLPDASVLPPIEAAEDRVPRPVLLGQVPTWCAGGEDPEDAVEDVSMRMRGTPHTWNLRRQERTPLLPVRIRGFMSTRAPQRTLFYRHAVVLQRQLS
jgi:hypothetical protein